MIIYLKKNNDNDDGDGDEDDDDDDDNDEDDDNDNCDYNNINNHNNNNNNKRNSKNIVKKHIKEKENNNNFEVSENNYYEQLLKYFHNKGYRNLLNTKLNNYIVKKQKEYQQNYDKDWNKSGRRFFVVFNIEDNKKIFYTHDVQDGKVIGIMIMMIVNFMRLMNITLILI
jgi:hypothetical protein